MLTISGDNFALDNTPFRILSGAIHYFRVVPEYWQDRLEKARVFGLNTIETYVAWNLHEPRPGEFHFEGGLDIVRFIHLAADLGLKVIVRPGPYICSEWEFGGLPPWLLKDPNMQVRCLYPPFLEAVGRYFEALLPRLVPLQSTCGGPIIAMQVENEYGSFGSDCDYLNLLVQGLRSRGVEVLLFTSDPPYGNYLKNGGLPELHRTVNYAVGTGHALRRLRKFQPTGPKMVTEFWSGWFDHWGERHHIAFAGLPSTWFTRKAFKDILAAGASFNFYMFHGGTNFGFMNGANIIRRYQPTTTSYDYAAPLSEDGEPTRKFMALRDLLRAAMPGLANLPFPKPIHKAAFGTVTLEEATPLFENLAAMGTPHQRQNPEPMEYFDQSYGFILYRTQVPGPRAKGKLELIELRDRAQVFQDGQPQGILEREFPRRKLSLAIPAGGARLDLLVENLGRVNFGTGLLDRKGITKEVRLGGQPLTGWEIYPLPLEDLSGLKFSSGSPASFPAFLRGTFDVDDPADTFLALPGWTKGVVWLNGFNLGRYWKRGPQHTLYVPAPLLHRGSNDLIVLELEHCRHPEVRFLDHPRLG